MADDVAARHKKEIKAFEAEKRTALKKIKGTAGKGKKGKELLAAAEAEYDAKFKELQEKHAAELSGSNDSAQPEPEPEPKQDPQEEERKLRQEKARRKREKAREKEREKERQIEEETANAGPAPRKVEQDMIEERLPQNWKIQEVAADGNCLYRAVGSQCGKEYTEMRSLCADTLVAHEDEFSPFCEYTDEVGDFAAYVERVRSSADWGGHLELRVLSLALKRPVWVYSAAQLKPMIIEVDETDDGSPIRVSYHQHYYALGEHYNEVVEDNGADL